MSDESTADTAEGIPLPGEAGPPGAPVDLAGLTHTGWVRTNNEDNFHVVRFGRYLRTLMSSLSATHVRDEFDQSGHGFVVTDGVGGGEAGEVASRMAITLLLDLVVGTPDWVLGHEDAHLAVVMDRFAARFGGVNEGVLAAARDRPGRAGMGTTLSLAVSLGDDLIVAHVGDSPVYLFRGGRLRRLTRDHVEQWPGADRLRYVLTRAIGLPLTGGQPDVNRFKLADGDRLLLCTDGLTDMADDDAIADVLGRGSSAADTCQALVELALAAGGRDNVTVVVAAYHFPAGAVPA